MLRRMLFPRVMLGLLVAGAATPSTGQTAVPPPVAAASPWPQIESDLPDDPALLQGTLPNGLRYLILPNAEPKDRVSLRLLVAAGSLHENDDERGLAHFVEHMAFRGTRAFPAGSMTAALQRLGVGLGPDSTAFTSYDHTIYHLELPDAKEATLREGLRVFREYADAVTFDPKLIERERGVVLNEMATRDTPSARAVEANFAFLWPAARETRRKIIGLPAQLQQFKRAQFVAFYEAWYRPERMALVIVGAVESQRAEKLLAEHFGTLKARAPARPAPPDSLLTEAAGSNVGVFTDPGIVGVGLSFEHPIFAPRETHSRAERELAVRQALAFSMLQNRLQKLASTPDASFVAPEVTLVRPRPAWKLATLGVSGRINDWRRIASEVEREHRRAILFGFTQRELTEVRSAFSTSYEQMARTARTRPSPMLAQQLVGKLLYGGPFVTPETLQREAVAALESATTASCLEALRSAWTRAAPSVFITANSVFDITRAQIVATLNESRKTPVTPPVEAAAPTFAYADFGPEGRMAEQKHLADLDVHQGRFENAVHLNFKRTTFESDTVEIRVRVGDGKLSQMESLPGVDLLADAAFISGGLGRHTAQELSEIVSSHALDVTFHVLPDALGFYARCAPRELDLALQVIAAFLSDASFRKDGMREARARINSMYAALGASPSGPIKVFALREMLTHDRRFGLPQPAEVEERELRDLEVWLQPQLKSGAVELSIVGDTEWEKASQAVARTLAALPARAPLEERHSHLPARFATPHPPGTERAIGIEATFRQAALAWYWPVPQLTEIREERRCHLLAMILADRLRLRLRDEIGATYAPEVAFVKTDGFSNLNYFTFYAELDPAKKKQAWAVIEREIAELRRRGPSADEFERAKQPYLRMIAENLRTNAYWGGTVLSDAQLRPQRIEAARDRAADNAAITREEIAALARKHLDPAHVFRFSTMPAATR